jgi:hypothetical protein
VTPIKDQRYEVIRVHRQLRPKGDLVDLRGLDDGKVIPRRRVAVVLASWAIHVGAAGILTSDGRFAPEVGQGGAPR